MIIDYVVTLPCRRPPPPKLCGFVALWNILSLVLIRTLIPITAFPLSMSLNFNTLVVILVEWTIINAKNVINLINSYLHVRPSREGNDDDAKVL